MLVKRKIIMAMQWIIKGQKNLSANSDICLESSTTLKHFQHPAIKQRIIYH